MNKTLQEVLKENHDYMQWKKEMRKKELKREKRRNMIVFIIVATFVLWLTFDKLLSMNDEAVKNCMKKGYSQQTCEIELS